MENEKLEEAYNNTFPGLTMYYRDCDLKQELVRKYTTGKIIMERGYTDISSFAEGLGKNLRYAIASNKAVDLGQVNPDVAKWGFSIISAPSYYKILDIHSIGDKTQILLLNFDPKYLQIFKSTETNIEEQIVEMGRESLATKIELTPNQTLYEKRMDRKNAISYRNV